MTINRRFAWLDGLRAVAVALVLAGHAKLSFHFELGRIGDIALRVLNARMGVQIFFVVSGFIITLLLLREKEECGTINLKSFWRRRGFRILPALWVFLLMLAAMQLCGLIAISVTTWLASLLFFRNHFGEGWFTGHLWSLGVEAQFYLLWPILVGSWPVSWLRSACFSGVFLAVIFRFVGALLGWQDLVANSLLGNLDLLLIGAMSAIHLSDKNANSYVWLSVTLDEVLKRKSTWLILAAVTISLSFLMTTRWSTWAMVFEPLFVGGSVACLIVHVHGAPECVTRRVLSSPPIALLGVWSYSLYLWQQIFLVHPIALPNSWMHEYPLIWPLPLFSITLASYYLIERHFNRWGHKSAQK